MIKCCIFDLDGTILNTISSITYYVNNALTARGIDTVSEEACKLFAGDGARMLVKRALESKGIYDEKLRDELLSEYIKAYDSDPWYLTAPFDGIKEVLSNLKERGIKIAVVSNKPDSTVKMVVPHFFGDVFDEILGIKDGVALKPDPAAARQVLKTLGVSESQTVWIGDTSVDVKTGKNLNVALNIGVLWGFRKREELECAGADIIVSRVDEIFSEVIAYD